MLLQTMRHRRDVRPSQRRQPSRIAIFLLTLGILGLPALAVAKTASLFAQIDISRQTMSVFIEGRPAYTWPVSTARRGYRTPVGTFRPKRLEQAWYSRKYDGAPMPHSVFFYGGYAVHGTTETRRLGQPVSHGCVRLHRANAKTFFDLVRHYGKADTIIRIVR